MAPGEGFRLRYLFFRFFVSYKPGVYLNIDFIFDFIETFDKIFGRIDPVHRGEVRTVLNYDCKNHWRMA
jgi:hypothetical protein